jgi:hypothetical protein
MRRWDRHLDSSLPSSPTTTLSASASSPPSTTARILTKTTAVQMKVNTASSSKIDSYEGVLNYSGEKVNIRFKSLEQVFFAGEDFLYHGFLIIFAGRLEVA